MKDNRWEMSEHNCIGEGHAVDFGGPVGEQIEPVDDEGRRVVTSG